MCNYSIYRNIYTMHLPQFHRCAHAKRILFFLAPNSKYLALWSRWKRSRAWYKKLENLPSTHLSDPTLIMRSPSKCRWSTLPLCPCIATRMSPVEESKTRIAPSLHADTIVLRWQQDRDVTTWDIIKKWNKYLNFHLINCVVVYVNLIQHSTCLYVPNNQTFVQASGDEGRV